MLTSILDVPSQAQSTPSLPKPEESATEGGQSSSY